MSSRKEQKEQLRQEREAAEQAAKASASRKRRMAIIGGVVGGALLVVAVAVIVSLADSSSNTVEGAGEVQSRLSGIPQDGIALGKPDAPVTIVEFADLKCPFCRDFNEHAFPTLVDDYIKDGKLRMEFRNLAFVGEATAPGDSMDAATFATASSQQDKMWQFVDLFYLNQKDEATRYATDEWLRKLGSAVDGLDVDKAMGQRESKAVTDLLTAAEEKFAEAGFSGTPSFLIGRTGEELNELTYSTVESADDFTQAVDDLLP